MRWSYRIGRFAGIDVYVHATFPLLLAVLLVTQLMGGDPVTSALLGTAFLLALFVCVLLHEFGHALAARRFGIATRDITLLPIGGLARLERLPERPARELVVALAGPAVNVAIAAFLFFGSSLAGRVLPATDASAGVIAFVNQLIYVNLALVVFNMLPAFPLDGGRVLRAVLALGMPHVKATQIAARVGQGFAVVFAVAGVFLNPFLVLIGVFVWWAARQEASFVRRKAGLSGHRVGAAVQTHLYSLSPYDRAVNALQLSMRSAQPFFPIVHEDRVLGLVSLEDLTQGVTRLGPGVSVGELMSRRHPPVSWNAPLDRTLMQMQASGAEAVPVVHRGRFAGVLTLENIRGFLRVQEAASRSEGPQSAGPSQAFRVPSREA